MGALLTALLLSGCLQNADAEGISGIHGNVLLGSTCPVAMDPPDPECRERAYQTKLAVYTEDLSRVVKEFESSDNGTFRVPLPPGAYQIQQVKESDQPGNCSTNSTVVVNHNDFTWATVYCDSGVRF